MIRRLLPALLGGTTVLAGLLLFAPASLLHPFAQNMSRGKLGMANCGGTLWNGQCTPYLKNTQQQSIGLPPLAWKIQFNWQDLPSAQLHWPAHPQPTPIQVAWQEGALHFSNLYIPLSASLIGELSEFVKPAGLQGSITFHAAELTLGNAGLQGTIDADWKNASSALSRIAPLGNYRIQITARGTTAQVNLMTTSGLLELNGTGEISQTGLRFNGTAVAREEDELLAELLGHLGPEVSPGVHRFDLTPH